MSGGSQLLPLLVMSRVRIIVVVTITPTTIVIATTTRTRTTTPTIVVVSSHFVLFYFLHSASTVYCYITPFPLINETTFFQVTIIEQRGGEVVPQPRPTTSSSHPALSQDPYLQHVQP